MTTPVAIDFRPALLARAGIGRAARELARALARRAEVDLRLFGHSLAAARVAVPRELHSHLRRLPIPGRSLPWLRRIGIGAEHLVGGARVFHWLDYVQPPVRAARTVLTIHDLAFARDASWHGRDAAVLAARTERIAAAATAIVVPSTTTATDVRRLLPTAPPPRVVPFGSDHVPTQPLARPRDVPAEYLLALGTIEPRKNHLALLAAIELLPPPRPLLVVVGRRGWECDEIERALVDGERRGRVQWRQDVDDDGLWALLQHARALVYPSLWEGFGFPPLEAMALGVPVVANDCEPLREVCDDNALLCDACSPAALAAAIERVLGDHELRRRLVDGGRGRSAALTWDAAALAHAALYREVAA